MVSARYFVRFDAQGSPCAVVRLVVDDETRTFRDEFWNPSLTGWEAGSFAMRILAVGDHAAVEVGVATISEIFPACPVSV